MLVLLQAVKDPDQAKRLARVSAWVLMVAAVAVVMAGLLSNSTATMLEGTLVALLALAGGWAYSRVAACILTLLLALGVGTGLIAGLPMPGLLLQVALFGICLRMAEATFKLDRSRG